MDTYVLTAGRQSQNTTRADFFEPSMKRCGNINWIHHKRVENKNSRSGFGGKDLRDFMVWKFSCAQHTCSTLPKDAMIVFSDIDIVWRSSAFEELSTYAERGVYAMRENEQGDLSAGLLVSKNTPAFQWLLYRCHNYLKHHSRCNSDDALRVVGKDNVKILPFCYANSETQSLTPISQVQCFHANSYQTNESQHTNKQKLQMLQRWFQATNL
jgi:hypothetical protein